MRCQDVSARFKNPLQLAKRRRRRQLIEDEEYEPGASKDLDASGNESHDDECMECNETGRLLCCDGCTNACHLDCAKPPVESMPEGDWFCVECMTRIDNGPKSDGVVPAPAPAPADDSMEQDVDPAPVADEPDNSSPFRCADGFPPQPATAPLTPTGKKQRKCGLCGAFGSGHNSRTCPAPKPLVGDFFEWGGGQIYIIDVPVVKVGQNYMCKFHKYGTERTEQRPISKLLPIILKGPYHGPLDSAVPQNQAGPPLVRSQVEERYSTLPANNGGRAVRNAVHPDTRDAALGVMRQEQQDSLERVRSETRARMNNAGLDPPLGSPCYGIVQLKCTFGVDGGDVPHSWLEAIKTNLIDTPIVMRAVAVQERGTENNALHCHLLFEVRAPLTPISLSANNVNHCQFLRKCDRDIIRTYFAGVGTGWKEGRGHGERLCPQLSLAPGRPETEVSGQDTRDWHPVFQMLGGVRVETEGRCEGALRHGFERGE